MGIEYYKGRTLSDGDRVRVYRNLHKKGKVYSIKVNGLVVAHADTFSLLDAIATVNEKGRQRVIFEGRKNVHAYIEGTFLSTIEESGNYTSVHYNPYTMKSFQDGNGDALHDMARIEVRSGIIYAKK